MRYSQASRCGTPSLSTVFDLKADPGHRVSLITRVNTDSPTSSLHRLLATAIFLSNYTVQLQCLQRAPGCRVTEKCHFSTLNVGLAGTGNQTQATCLAGSVSRRSAIHYAILSPSCGWNCAMNELLTRLRKTKTHCKAFADDGALITCNKKLSEAMKDAQKAINVAVEWA
jgi:hypothetical protein